MANLRQLKPVKPQPGRPLYSAVKETLRDAIDRGVFVPGQQMPSTKELSEQLRVSLVTAHRALQELVSCGVLERSQGRGTFVHERYLQRRHAIEGRRVGLVFHREASLADYYHGQILEGVHRAADPFNIDLILLRFGEDVRNECSGFLLVNPFVEEVGRFAKVGRRQPMLVVGAQSAVDGLPSYDVDNLAIPRLAVEHLVRLGHRNIAYVGGAYKISNSRDRWVGFQQACRENQLPTCDHALVKGSGWRLDERERATLADALRSPDRPTAIFAAGYNFALEVYAAATAVGLRVPQDLSVVGVDDPSSAAHLSPPLTTVRQPLAQLGQEALAALSSSMASSLDLQIPIHSRRFAPELVARQSSAALSDAAASTAAPAPAAVG
jgi:DNA-binding LacI/PurR family transcriptional regulator